MKALSVSASGRYDKYNDFGDTFNPKLGVTWKPVDWITVTGNWGKSFSAPSPTDQLGTATATSLVLSPGSFPNGAALNPPVVAGQTTYAFVLLRGAIGGLEPQTSVNWSVGARIEPPFIPGLRLNGSYYFIHYANAIGSPNTSTDIQIFFRNYPNLVTVDPTPAQLQALAAQVNGGLTTLATIPAGGRIVSMYDIRTRNLGVTRLSGLDLAANYISDTSFGSIDASISANYALKSETQVSPTAPVVDNLAFGASRLRLSATAGATIGNFRAQATYNRSEGYDIIPILSGGMVLQTHVGSFSVVNLHFRYNVNGSGIGKDLSFSLGIDNVLDQDPPILRNSTQNGAAGLTIGRLFQFGISKKF